MRKLYVIVSSEGRTPEQVEEIRQNIRSDVEEGLADEVELLPYGEGIAEQVASVVQADIVVSTQASMYDRDCRICNLAAAEYVQFGVYEEDWVEETLRQRREERAREQEAALAAEEVPDEDMPA